ncbi:hypothetical protein LWP59_36430 [Amycolatopsis acidiphila]|uniref:Uncharacterized protein n=1 Tax=Amycolatopsis acidiphila TaxID=715473 RepID=A0A557ZXI6_9PSEU|nr:hypothetical protein [Amycolatopsis acidiphila]TVT16743.1 hypothetical protein FNH06_34190 [Amycolatopsis acidiphila]UIJ59461.1 hypothetical protein LWP59_36430 [Amycolatopsis acidiphila]GHG94636.1 hypothetical protein GCM10017788_72620 [Amycolatopsis acidiphila]
MPAKDDAEFGDGTQSALPPVTFGDALSGSLNDEDEHEDFKLTRVASPVRPDPAVVRDLVDAATAEGQRPGAEFGDVHFQTTPPGAPAQPIAPAPPLGMLPLPRQRTRPSLRSVKRPQLRMPRLGLPQSGNVRRVRPSSGSTAMIVAVLLMIVFAVVAIEFLSSLISGITGLFS